MIPTRLTVFTPTHITTASLCEALDAQAAANAPEPAVSDCITLTHTMRVRFAAQRSGRKDGAAAGKGNQALQLRIPFPTNDNMAPLRA